MTRIVADLRLDRENFRLELQLDVPAQGVTALFGPSGCGKTSTLRAIAGLERAQGRLGVAGDMWQDDARRHFVPTHRRPLGYVFQEASLFAHLRVRANVEYGLRRIAPAQRRVALDHAVDLLGIGPLMDRVPDTLSGGERQRVAIARAIATSPRLLLLDEPLAALDAARKHEVLPYLEQLHRNLDIPVLYVSHAMDEVARLADTLVVMEHGRVQACGPLAATLARVDLPVGAAQEPGVVLHALVAQRDAQWHLAQVVFEAGELWVRDTDAAIGQAVRVRVLARDVSLALARPEGSSIQNLLPCVVRAIAADAHPSQALVQLACGQALLLARITARAVHTLGLEPGRPVWAQVKSAALVD
jgi:molybdate transport system ATP-binding protein